MQTENEELDKILVPFHHKSFSSGFPFFALPFPLFHAGKYFTAIFCLLSSPIVIVTFYHKYIALAVKYKVKRSFFSNTALSVCPVGIY